MIVESNRTKFSVSSKPTILKKVILGMLSFLLAFSLSSGPVLAQPDNDQIVVKKGETSDNVILVQLRLQDLGYYNYKITGFFGDFTKEALVSFQKTNGLSQDGVAGEQTLNLMFSNTAKRKPVEPRVKPKPKPKSNKVPFGKYWDWFGTVNNMWKKGEVCKVYDLDSGILYYMKRVGGQYHADVAPTNKAENAKFIRSYGGQKNYPSWDRRAVIVNIHGTWVAGSTNGYPHGSTGVPGNGMIDPTDGSIGQVCIHFKGSHTHIHNMIDPDHQRQIKRAAGLIK